MNVQIKHFKIKACFGGKVNRIKVETKNSSNEGLLCANVFVYPADRGTISSSKKEKNNFLQNNSSIVFFLNSRGSNIETTTLSFA